MMTTMDIRDTGAIIKVLNEAGGEDVTTYRIETFRMDRVSPKHGHQKVTVTIRDRGPGNPPRYHVLAQTPEGKCCTGNPNDDLEVALRTVHWFEFDK